MTILEKEESRKKSEIYWPVMKKTYEKKESTLNYT